MPSARLNPNPTLVEAYALDRSAEWNKLLTHLEFTPRAFSFLILRTPDATGGEICRRALEGWAAARQVEFVSWDCADAEELRAIPARLSQWEPGEQSGLLWISGHPADAGAWQSVAMRLNEFRDALRRRLPLPVVLEGPESLQDIFREHAPDLWSIRDLVVTVRPLSAPPEAIRPETLWNLPWVEPVTTDPAADYQQACLLLGAPEPNRGRGARGAAELLQRAARGWIFAGDWARALQALQQAEVQFALTGDAGADVAYNHLLRGLVYRQLHDFFATQAALEAARALYESVGDIRGVAMVRSVQADILEARGEYDEALRIRCEEMLPVFEKLGDVRSRATTLGKIADIYQLRGDNDGALRIRREEELPVYEKLGDIRSRASTLGKIADIYQLRGEYDEALRIRREGELPVFDKLGDIRSRALILGKVSDIHEAKGDYGEALRIRREEVLPVFYKLGDIRSRAVTYGRIADIVQARGEFDEALRIRREEELPVYDKVGDIRERAVTVGKIADICQARGEFDEALRIRREEELPIYDKLGDILAQAVTRGKIAMTLFLMGDASAAIELFQSDAIPALAALRAEDLLAQTRTLLAEVYLARNAAGDRAKARQLLVQARETAQRLGLAPWLPQIERLLAQALLAWAFMADFG
ncbi:MAG: hypothetical protein K2X03_26675 [Bryobacteraceae bacterium]|nr:hypothetical protein [Bryobacteraceae bacterium]